ncbi:TatABCE protein translocation system subunit [endosymbiont of Acanthamoeba sp. UWC8]|uniref:twin-arginine translocase subunit TatC n=1 Tax=endosymbiont of Acanthamoeba sp. UWC8 TaxID=86106 RepID=UPI0004D1D61B|nr:twin-arginine translocase subunit TatC [endosymbiont of Acanthamoeba sp. UWC8]AIF80887.1 TatABCE protein translocation system subunit [endosymbiont of Acanthamoeba sp. UWC8]
MKKIISATILLSLRPGLFLCVITFIFFALISYYFSEQIYGFLTKPLLEIYSPKAGRRLIFTNLTEAFFTYFKVACYSGFIFSFPFIAFQLYFFVAPGLYRKEKWTLIPILLFIPILFFLGAATVYYFVIPMAWKFFLSFENVNSTEYLPVMLEAKISDYLDLTLEMIIGFGIAFQLPIIALLLAKAKVLKGSWLADKRKYAVVVIFIVAAILTPPDVISQVLLAIPLLLLYEISIVICKVIEKV